MNIAVAMCKQMFSQSGSKRPTDCHRTSMVRLLLCFFAIDSCTAFGLIEALAMFSSAPPTPLTNKKHSFAFRSRISHVQLIEGQKAAEVQIRKNHPKGKWTLSFLAFFFQRPVPFERVNARYAGHNS
jgi:hypothetical protein